MTTKNKMRIKIAAYLLIPLFFLMQPAAAYSSAQQDSTLLKFNRELINIISSVPPVPDSLNKMSDNLISQAGDSLFKSYIAIFLYNYFKNAPVMGVESSAIYIADNYILNGRLKGFSDDDLMDVNLFAAFNRSSLIGKKGPELLMRDTSGKEVSLHNISSAYTLLYFYDDQCPVCKAELPKIIDITNKYEHLGISVLAVYTQPSDSMWRSDIKKSFNNISKKVRWTFVHDPDIESNFQIKYGVISTPKIFLLDSSKTIVGRSLSHSSLQSLLEQINGQKRSAGDDSMKHFFEEYLSNFNLSDTTDRERAFSLIFQNSKSDPQLRRDLLTSLFYFLYYSQRRDYQESAQTLANSYILPYVDFGSDTTLRAKISHSSPFTTVNMTGDTAQSLRLKDLSGSTYRTDEECSKYTVLYFFDFNCKICEIFSAELIETIEELQQSEIRIVAIYTGSDYTRFAKYALSGKNGEMPNRFRWLWLRRGEEEEEMYQKYDLSYVPALYLLDKDMRIIAKNINPKTLKQLIK